MFLNEEPLKSDKTAFDNSSSGSLTDKSNSVYIKKKQICRFCKHGSMCFVCNKKKGKHPFLTNKSGPKQIWVPKDKIIFVADILHSKVKTPIMVPGQWLLTSHYGRKAYVPRTKVPR